MSVSDDVLRAWAIKFDGCDLLKWAMAIELLALRAAMKEPAAWQNTATKEIYTDDELDPMWKPIMRPLYALPAPPEKAK